MQEQLLLTLESAYPNILPVEDLARYACTLGNALPACFTCGITYLLMFYLILSYFTAIFGCGRN